jgi:hypothetical protein
MVLRAHIDRVCVCESGSRSKPHVRAGSNACHNPDGEMWRPPHNSLSVVRCVGVRVWYVLCLNLRRMWCAMRGICILWDDLPGCNPDALG